MAAVALLAVAQSGHGAALRLPAAPAFAQEASGLALPWEGGAIWRYTNPPHGSAGEAVDFQPPDAAGKICEQFVSSFWVVAAADGTVINKQNGLEIDHGNGIQTGYYHLADKQVTAGPVQAGDRLGHPACCPEGYGDGCWATAPHLHFYINYHGSRTSISGLKLGEWTVGSSGCLERDGGGRACENAYLVSGAPASTAAPSTPADIVLLIDSSSSMSGDVSSLRLEAALGLFSAAIGDDRVSVIEFNSSARMRSPLQAPKVNGQVAEQLIRATDVIEAEGLTNMRPGLLYACQTLLRDGTAPKRAVILLSDGRHNQGQFRSAESCLAQHGWPVFTYGVGSAVPHMLEGIASRSGGEYKQLSRVDNMACEFQRVRSLISGDLPRPCTTYQLGPGEILSLPYRIPAGQLQAAFTVAWSSDPAGQWAPSEEQGGIAVSLAGANGRRLDPATLAAHERRTAAESFTISHPEPGDYTVFVSGVTTLEGLYVSVTVTTVPVAFEHLLPIPTNSDPIFPTPEPTPAPDEGTPTDTASPSPETETPRPTREPPTPSPEPTPRETRPADTPAPLEPTPLGPTPEASPGVDATPG